MKTSLLQQAAQFYQNRRRKQLWYRVVSGMACVVVFCTVYALILPAITLEKEPLCGMEEHTHTEDCYTTQTLWPSTEYLCDEESLLGHTHDETCYDEDGALVCGCADFVVHTHNKKCYDRNGDLVCPLPEIEEHEHDRYCYLSTEVLTCGQEETGHIHGSTCYTRVRGDLCCGLEEFQGHTHDSGCFETERTLACTLEEGEDHTHDESCYETREVLTCQLEESEGHAHSDACYDWTAELSCGREEDLEGHIHSADCYTTVTELICGEEEIILHTHDESCFDEDGNLTCGKLQVLEHRHDETCAVELEGEPEEVQVLVCGKQEHTHIDACYEEDVPLSGGPVEQAYICGLEEHTHTEDCYDEAGELICTLEEHTHNAECLEAGEGPEYLCGLEEHTHSQETCYNEAGELICTLDEHTHTEACLPAVALFTVAEPIELDNYITGATLYYRTDSTEEWSEVTEDTAIPGTAELKSEAKYADVPLSDLMANGGILQIQLPALLRNPTAEGIITDENGERIGTASVESGVLTIDFDESWLQTQKSEDNTLIGGSFYVTSKVNLSQIGGNGDAQLVFGNAVIIAHFEEDIQAKNGTVTLSKTVAPKIIESADGDYAEYTLTVTAGEDGCPQVRVVDHFSANGDYASYVGVSQTAKTLTSSGSPGETVAVGKSHGTIYLDSEGNLIWEIGDMAANETRTLRYRVKLEEGYTYIQNSDSKLISNEAQAYAAQYPKDKATADLEPKAGLNLQKTAANPVQNEDGSYTITYTLVAEANRSNLFTLKNVSISDLLNDPEKSTNEASLPYIQYVDGSFQYFAGNSASGTATAFSPEMNADGKGFTATLGDLAPGEAYCIQYQVRIGLEALSAAGGEKLLINNTVTAFSDNARLEDFDYLGTKQQSKYLQYSHWAKKLVGDPITADTSVPISGGSIYDATGTEPVPETNTPESFTAPSGCYLYTVLVNEKGDWDVTSASMTDRIDGTYMQFVGYVKVEALDTENGNAVVNTLWVKVDGNTSFNFTMAQLGLTGNQYAYRLRYYAEPKTIDGTAAVIVKNSFTLSGTIIPGTGDPFVLTGVTASKDVILKGGNTIEAEKSSWYYEGPTSSVGNYGNGTLYWVIKVSGDAVRAGTYIQDYLTTGSHYSYIRADSFVGVYTSTLSSNELTKYNDMESALNSGQLTPVDDSYYSVETVIGAKTQDTSSVTVKMEATLPLNGRYMYIVIKTAPAFLPPHPWFGNPLYYYNYLRTSDDGQNWTERRRANDILYEGTNIWKKVGAVFKYNGESIQETTSGSTGTIVTSELGEPGMFVSWDITVNYAGDLSGRYRLEDTLPDGMELAYVRLQQRGSTAKSTNVPQISGLSGDYSEHSMTAKPQGESAEITTWYYTDGDTILWDVDNLVATKAINTGAVTFQVVCRVTDPDVLLGGETREFKNQVTLYGEDGRQRDIDTQTVSVTTETLKKAVDQGGRTLPFTITVNSLGEDLLEGADTLTVVDTLSDTLQLDPLSITVVNSNTQESVRFDASVEGNTLRVTIPDNQPVTIKYNAKVLAKPSETVNIKNDAHWEGYATTGGGSIEIKNYAYSVGGTAGGSATPYVEIIKYDSSSVMTRLPGAEFEMVGGTMENGVFTPSAGEIWTGTTDEQGMLKFGDAPNLMAYNTVYQITETKAPDGFVLDSTPVYFVVAADASTEYPAMVDVFYASKDDYIYVCPVGNGRGTATVMKQFEDLGQTVGQVSGTYRFGIYDTENPVGDPMQTVTMTFTIGQTPQNTAKFSNLELGKTYYIYELDDSGKPIRNGETALVDGKKFTVTYPDGSAVTIANDGGSSTVTINNSVSYPKLPETGGTGTHWYTLGGLCLMAGALLLLYRTKTRGKGGRERPC